MIAPLKNNLIVSSFGTRELNGKTQFHNGIDLRAEIGTDIMAPADGFVFALIEDAKTLGGMQIVLKHADCFTGYAHLSKQLVKKGEAVKQGQVFSKTGNSGNSGMGKPYAAHLHHTVRDLQYNPVNPITVYPEGSFNN